MRTIPCIAAFAVACALALRVAWGVIGGLDAPVGTGGAPRFDLPAIEHVRTAVASVEAAAQRGDTPSVVLFGDSTAIWWGDHPSVPAELQRALHRKGLARAAVVPAAYPMMGPVDYFYAAHEIAEAGPDAVVATINSGALSVRTPRTDMAGMIPVSALPWALRYPLHQFGLTFDRLLLASAIVRSGVIPWYRPIKERQTKLGDWRALQVGDALARDGFGRLRPYFERMIEIEGRRRTDAEGMRMLFGEALDGADGDHPVLQMIEGMVGVLRDREIAVVVYVNPMNLEWLDRVGIEDHSGLRQTIAVLRTLVEAHGASLVDLHAMLPDEAFRDAAGHMEATPPHHAAQRIAAEIAGALIPALDEAR